MRSRFPLPATLFFLAVLAVPVAPARAEVGSIPDSAATTVIVVRHAEKDTLMLGADPPLSAPGLLRAQELARVLADAGISAIYVTPWQRNRQTAQPLATRLGDTLTVVDAVDETVERLRTRHAGRTVLVVGHSNTIPQIIEKLAGVTISPFVERDFDRLYVVTLIPGRPARVTVLHYGAARAP